jgi:hypothetical protein
MTQRDHERTLRSSGRAFVPIRVRVVSWIAFRQHQSIHEITRSSPEKSYMNLFCMAAARN